MARRYKTQSPLEQALGPEAAMLHAFIDDLYHQMAASIAGGTEFSFNIAKEKAAEIKKQYNSTICSKELLLDTAVRDILLPYVTAGEPSIIYETHGRCPTDNRRFSQSFSIGSDVKDDDYRKTLARTDSLLADEYKPVCPRHGERCDTILSFTRYYPKELGSLFKAVSEAEYLMLQHESTGHKRAYTLARRALEQQIELYGHSVYSVSTRIKSIDRFVEKITRQLVEKYLQEENGKGKGKYARQMLDVFGTRLTTKNRRQAYSTIYSIKKSVEERQGKATIREAIYSLKRRREAAHMDGRIIDDCIFSMEKEGHRSYKLWFPYERDGSSIWIAAQTMSREDEMDDKKDHRPYEERQLVMLKHAEQKGLPVRQLRSHLQTLLGNGHSSSSEERTGG
jgi:hypothetical protein